MPPSRSYRLRSSSQQQPFPTLVDHTWGNTGCVCISVSRPCPVLTFNPQERVHCGPARRAALNYPHVTVNSSFEELNRFYLLSTQASATVAISGVSIKRRCGNRKQ